MSGLQYPFPVFIVDQCPRNRTSWKASSMSRNCPVDINNRDTYNCVPNQQISALLEFCYTRPIGRHQNGSCLYLRNDGFLNEVRCTDFIHGCPEETYLSNEIYKYQGCLTVDKQYQCFEAAKSCRNKTKSTDVSSSISPTSSEHIPPTSYYMPTLLDYVPILLGVIVPITLIGILCVLFMVFQQKRNLNYKYNIVPEQEPFRHTSKENFIRTRAYQRAKEVLFKKKYVIIKGNPGDGKTTIAEQLFKELETFFHIRLEVFTGLRELLGKNNRLKNTVIFVDNLFGEYIFKKDEIEQWDATIINMEYILSNEINKKGNYLIATIRNDMHSKILSLLQSKMEFIDNALVDISDSANNLTRDEMKKIFELYVDIHIPEDELFEAFNFAPPLGFPQACKLFGKSKILQDQGSSFFKNPFECLIKYVEKMYLRSELQFSVLVYILMNNGCVSMSSLRDYNSNKEEKEIAMCACYGEQDSTIFMFTNCIEGLIGSFLYAENGQCMFSHSCIQNVVESILMKYNLSFVIQYCDLSMLMHLYTKGNKGHTENVQTVDHTLYSQIYEKIVKCLRGRLPNGLFQTISFLNFWKDMTFCTKFQEFVKNEQGLLNKLDENNTSLLVHFANAGQFKMTKFLLKIIYDEDQRYYALNQATLMNHQDLVQMLLEEGVAPCIKSCFCAIQNGNKDIVMLFINKGLDLYEFAESRHPVYKCSASILAESCIWERLELISFLLETYPYLCNLKNNNGEHGIHFLAFAGATNDLKRVISEYKFDPYLKSNRGETILHNACQNGKLETAKYIISQYPDLLKEGHDLFRDGSILHMTASGGNINLFKFLIDKGLNINVRNNSGKTVLHQCCLYGRIELCKYLVTNHPQLLDNTDNYGQNALHCAALSGNIELLEFLVDKIDINSTRYDGRTVLHLCSMAGEIDMFKYLVNTYPELVHVTDKNNDNALQVAEFMSEFHMHKILTEKGFDIKGTENRRIQIRVYQW